MRTLVGALGILENRFDRMNQIVNQHIQRICESLSKRVLFLAGLRMIHETADDVKRALQAIQREDRACWLIYLLVTKVDPES